MAQFKKDEVRSKILDAARELFIRTGVEETRISDVARMAGISVGNLYRYFEGKEQLVDAICPPDLLEAMKKSVVEIMDDASKQKSHAHISQDELMALKMRFDEILFENQTALLIVASRPSIFASLRGGMVEVLVALVKEQYLNCPYMPLADKADETMDWDMEALQLIYSNLMEMTLDIFRLQCSDDKKRHLLKKINAYHFSGLKTP